MTVLGGFLGPGAPATLGSNTFTGTQTAPLFVGNVSSSNVNITGGTIAGVTSIQQNFGVQQSYFGTVYPAQYLSVIGGGTAGAENTFVGPELVFSRYGSPSTTACASNANNTACNPVLGVYATGTASDGMVITGIDLGASGSSTIAGSNIQALNCHGKVTGSGVGIAGCGYLEGFRSTATGNAQGVEITAWNFTTSDCGTGTSSIGGCDAIWATARGLTPSGPATILGTAFHCGQGNAFGTWQECLTINSNAVASTGNGIGIYSNDLYGIDIAGTHSGHSIVSQAGAGTAFFVDGLGTSGALAAGGAITTTGGTAPGLSNGSAYMIGSATTGLTMGGRGSAQDFEMLNKNGVPVFGVGTGGTQLSILTANFTTAPFIQAGQASAGGSSTLGGVIAGSGSVDDLVLENKNAVVVAQIPTGTTNFQLNATTYPSCTALTTNSTGVIGCTPSDVRLKTDDGTITPSDGLAAILSAPDAHKFHFKEGYGPSGDMQGFFAQDIAKEHPAWVSIGQATELTPDGQRQFDQVKFIPDLVQGMKAQQAEIVAVAAGHAPRADDPISPLKEQIERQQTEIALLALWLFGLTGLLVRKRNGEPQTMKAK